MDGLAAVARRFPLVARPRPLCLPLEARVRALEDLARTAGRDSDHGTASSVFNQAALLASDLGLPELARRWCRQHAGAYLRHCPLRGMDAIRGLLSSRHATEPGKPLNGHHATMPGPWMAHPSPQAYQVTFHPGGAGPGPGVRESTVGVHGTTLAAGCPPHPGPPANSSHSFRAPIRRSAVRRQCRLAALGDRVRIGLWAAVRPESGRRPRPVGAVVRARFALDRADCLAGQGWSADVLES
jgi:hypothetical protein